MSQQNQNLHGLLTGIAVTAAAHWTRYDDETQRRLRNTRLDAKEALDLVRDQQSRGEVIRRNLPTVMDAEVGLAIANPQPVAAETVPSTALPQRPDLTMSMEKSISEMTWPPEPGTYDERGKVVQTGELTSMFLALTYEEVRAFVQGLAQSRPPSREAKVQIFLAANALVEQIGNQTLTAAQYRACWAKVFGQPVVRTVAAPRLVDLHSDPQHPPKVSGPLAVNVSGVVPLSSTHIPGYPFANQNTDRLMRFRIKTVGNVGPDQPIAAIQFGSEFRREDGAPIQPGVFVSAAQNRLYADLVTASGFVLMNHATLVSGQELDVFVRVEG